MTADVVSPAVSIDDPKCYERQDLHALSLVDDPIWVFDSVRKSMWYANDAAVQLWSAKSLADLLGRDFRKDMSEATATRLDDYLLKFSSDDSAIITDQWTFYPNGLGPKTVNTRAKGIAVEEGRIALLFHGTIQETTSKQNQEALLAVEMLRHLPVAVCLADLDGNTMSQNPEALAVFGSIDEKKNQESRSEKMDDPAEATRHANKESFEGNNSDSAFVNRFVDRDLGQRILQNVRTGEKVHRLEALQHTVHGPKWSAIQVKKTKDPVTSQPILLYSSRDISAMVEAERKAVAADSAKMDLLADMKHAIRCPLQHVVGVVELISRNNPNDSERCVCKEEDQEGDCGFDSSLRPSAQLLLTVLNDLMVSIRRVTNEQPDNPTTTYTNNNQDDNQIQHRSSGTAINGTPDMAPYSHINLEHRPIDIMNIVENAVATITPNAKNKDLSVTTRITAHLRNISVMGDGNRLQQLIFEILQNAVKHTSRGGISVSVQRLSKKQSRRLRLRFEVQDTGVGLNLEQQRTILQPDKQLEHCRGLKISQSLVKAMGGEIGVHSKPSFGTTFWFEIPFLCLGLSNLSIGSGNKRYRNNGGKSALAPVLDEYSDDDDGGLQVLLVDSDNVGRTVMAALLQQSGHSVAIAGTGQDMVRLVKNPSRTPFDVVLVETQLGGGGANYSETMLKSIREIRRLGFSKEALPILALTASVPLASYPELGLNDWLIKPISIKDIQKAMTNAICNNVESCTGSVDNFSLDNLSTTSIRSLVHKSTSTHTDDSPPSIPRRGSFQDLVSVTNTITTSTTITEQ